MIDRGIYDNDGDDCVNNYDDLRAISPWVEVVTSDERWDLLSGVWVLGSAYFRRVKGEGGGLVGCFLSVLLSVLLLVLSVLSYHDASASIISWSSFTNTYWVPGE